MSRGVIGEALMHCCACRTPPVWMWVDFIDVGIGIIIFKVFLMLQWIIVSKCIVMTKTNQVFVGSPAVKQIKCELTFQVSEQLPVVSSRQSVWGKCCNKDTWCWAAWLLMMFTPHFLLSDFMTNLSGCLIRLRNNRDGQNVQLNKCQF